MAAVEGTVNAMLQELFEIIEARKASAAPATSYTARLLAAGEDEILKKVGEEAVEVILAAKAQGDARLVEELADLFYHALVLLAARGLRLADVEQELRRRHRAPPPASAADADGVSDAGR